MAEDITTEAFIYYWEKRHTLANETNIPAYVLTVIKSKCLNYLGHLRVKSAYADHMQSHAAWELNLRISTLEACDPYELFTQELHQLLREAMAALPEKTREIILLYRFENRSHKEIAKQLKLSTKTVEYHLSKGMKLLRHALRGYLTSILFFF